LLGCALLIVTILPVVLSAVSGSLSIPHNDAWSYSRIAQEFGRTGEFRLLGWNRSALLGQIVVLGPLAASIPAQQIFVALLAAVAVLACYDLLASAVGRIRAAVAALVLAVWPELGLLATSFMSDVPALAATLGCLALGRRALADSSLPLLAGSLTIGLWGVTIREPTLAAPAAVLLTALALAWRGRLFRLPAVLGLGAAFIAAFVAFEWWRRSLARDDPPAPLPDGPILPEMLDVTIRGYFLLALAVSPAVLAVARPWRWSAGAWLASAGTAAVAVLAWHDYRLRGFLMSDYLMPPGPYPAVFLGDRSMIGDPVLRVIVLLAGACGALLAGLIVAQGRRLTPLLRWFLLLTVGGMLATRAAGQTVFGRYLVVLVPVLLLVVLAERDRPAEPAPGAQQATGARTATGLAGWAGTARRARTGWATAIGGAIAGFLAVLSLTVTAYGSAVDAARWNVGRQLVASGVPATDIDAGFEWSGYHAPNGVDYGPPDAPRINWYSAKFADNRPCFAVASSAQSQPDWHLLRTVGYREYVVTGDARLWVYDTGYCSASP
jgi:4-amino-4-deoxy-L-arabinose transferase-like glycosyltransferase